jgi:hypothetical protein
MFHVEQNAVSALEGWLWIDGLDVTVGRLLP